MKRRIVIIGGGQLGSRHLQALAKLEEPAYITVVDPSAGALETCQNRVREVPGWERHAYEFLPEMAKHASLDFAVVATAASVRRQVLETLLATTTVQNVLLEKVLFQRASDCVEVGRLLNQKGVKCWVNAARRMWPFYRGLKQAIQGETVIHFRQTGGGWGLACNAYHFLDLFSFLSGSGIRQLSSDFLDRQTMESKRKGFKELSGTLVGSLENGCFLSISDYRRLQIPSALLIETDRRTIRIVEAAKTVEVLAGPALEGSLVLQPKHQSELTQFFVHSVLSGEFGSLTDYGEASLIHRGMLQCFADIFAPDEDKETALCPVT